MSDEIPILLTPGPLSTSASVKRAMLRDWSTWDGDYNAVVQRVRGALASLASPDGAIEATTVLMQGSGTFAVEATLGTAVRSGGRLMIVRNGAYGDRMLEIARRLGLDVVDVAFSETEFIDVDRVVAALRDSGPTYLAMVHCETTTGMLNPADAVGAACRAAGCEFILDAMSSFGGIPMTLGSTGADYLISSANKCIQGVPGFGFVVARRDVLAATQGRSRSLSLDLYDQWRGMEEGGGKWRFTSPTHVVLAFDQALTELEAEGGVVARHDRYSSNQRRLVEGMRELGFRALLPAEWQSPIITGFHDPIDPKYAWRPFYDALKQRGFLIYPGKVTDVASFRIGSIGEVYAADVERLLASIGEAVEELGLTVG